MGRSRIRPVGKQTIQTDESTPCNETYILDTAAEERCSQEPGRAAAFPTQRVTEGSGAGAPSFICRAMEEQGYRTSEVADI